MYCTNERVGAAAPAAAAAWRPDGGAVVAAKAASGGSAAAVPHTGAVDVGEQVHRLIAAATSHENLAQAYAGWCSFW